MRIVRRQIEVHTAQEEYCAQSAKGGFQGFVFIFFNILALERF